MKFNPFSLLVAVFILSFAPMRADDGGYYIRNYAVNATVDPNNTWHITEVVDLTFTEPRHGFYRLVPESYSIPLNVGAKSVDVRYSPEVSDFKVIGWPFENVDQDGEIGVKIGDPDVKVFGDQQYIITYTYRNPDDRLNQYLDHPYDFLFQTLLPVNRNAVIQNFDFDITFVKPLPDDIEARLEIYAGPWGNTSLADNVSDLSVSPHLISGRISNLGPDEVVSLYAKLPEGYFVGVKSISPDRFYLFLILALASALILFVIELLNRLPPLTKPISFYPPDGISSAEVGTIIDESADLSDLTSLIPWWASKGLLKIEEIPDEKGRTGKYATLKLYRLENLPADAPEYQQKFWNLLFADGRRDSVNLSDLGEHPKEIADAQLALSRLYKGDRKLSSVSWSIALFFPVFLFGLLTFFYSSPVELLDANPTIVAFFIWGGLALADFIIVHIVHNNRFLYSRATIIALFIVRLVLLLAAIAFSVWLIWSDDPKATFFTPASIAAIFVAMFVVIEFSTRCVRYSDYRNQMIGQILGFREFIDTAERQQLQTLQLDDPVYFFRILPYAMVLGLADNWSKKFSDIDIQQPQWFQSSAPLNAFYFTSLMSNNLHNDIQKISVDTSSHSSGGGFAGGGGGGGSCGSW